MNSEVALLIAAFLSISVAAPVMADNYYFRTKGSNPASVGTPGNGGETVPEPEPEDPPLELSGSGIPSVLEAESLTPYFNESVSISGGSGTYVSAEILNQGDLDFSASINGNGIAITGNKDIGLAASRTYPSLQIKATDDKGSSITGNPFDLVVKAYRSAGWVYPVACYKGTGAVGGSSTPFPCSASGQTCVAGNTISTGQYVEYVFDRPVQFWDRAGVSSGYISGGVFAHYYFRLNST